MNSTRGPIRRRTPDILKTPIIAPRGSFAGDTPADEPAHAYVSNEVWKRVQALFDWYDLPSRGLFDFGSKYDPRVPVLLDLVVHMGMEMFPNAFFVRREGEVTKTKKRSWTAPRKFELVVIFREAKRRGLTQEEAAELYISHNKHLTSVRGLIIKYKQAELWLRNKDFTDMDAIELMDVFEVLGDDPTTDEIGNIPAMNARLLATYFSPECNSAKGCN